MRKQYLHVAIIVAVVGGSLYTMQNCGSSHDAPNSNGSANTDEEPPEAEVLSSIIDPQTGLITVDPRTVPGANANLYPPGTGTPPPVENYCGGRAWSTDPGSGLGGYGPQLFSYPFKSSLDGTLCNVPVYACVLEKGGRNNFGEMRRTFM